MPKLPTPSAHEIIRALNGQGFQVVSQKGSHIKIKHRFF
ncbi:type II toxin-antitoxin system HicA family toxin [Methanosarcina lacustris]